MMWTRSITSPETRINSSLDSDGDITGLNALGTPNAAFVGNGIPAHSSVRTLTSVTYLRRMHLGRDDAGVLFPDLKKMMEFVFITKMKRRISPGKFKIGISVSLQDSNGRRWPVLLECLRTAGQRHVRLSKGWAEVCRANGFLVGKRIRLARRKQESSSSSSDALVTVSVV